MISRLGLWISRVFQRTCPDPFVLVVMLTVVAAALALCFGTFPGQKDATFSQKAVKLLEDWDSDRGLWKFLAFSMQMCLVLLTGHALAATRPIRAMIERLAGVPSNTAQAAAMVGLVASATALLNWGLGLVVGALLARDVGRSMACRGAPCHYPLIAAAGYMGLLIWHGGISGSAPLSMTTLAQAKRVLPAELVEARGSAILVGLDRTLLSPLNLFVTAGLLVLIPIVLYLLAPKSKSDTVPFDRCSSLPIEPVAAEAAQNDDLHATIPDKLDRSPLLAWLIAIPLLLGLSRYLMNAGWQAIGLSEVIAFMFMLGLLLHGSLKRYAAAVEEGASDCAGIVIQFPLYGGILVMMQTSGLAEQFSSWMASQASARTLPLLIFLTASILNMFITSGGGLWGVMGPIALTTGEAAGVAPERMIMAVAYGDQVTNMLQPFWALPLLAITGVKARDIVGYTCVVMLAAYVWIGLGLLLF